MKVVRLWGSALIAATLPLYFAPVNAQDGPQCDPPLDLAPRIGAPLPGLTQTELNTFSAGLQAFTARMTPPSGLGPAFNGISCGECHRAAAPGGASPILGFSRVTRIGGTVNGAYSDLENLGGPVLQSRSLRELIPNYPIVGEVVPRGVPFVSHRITTPLFGDGLIEAIPGSTIMALSQRVLPDGVHGVPNLVFNAETGRTEVGRFGWKAQHSVLHTFASDAMLNEMGITNRLFSTENLPQGRPIPPGADRVPELEDPGRMTDLITVFMRLLAPPPPKLFGPTEIRGRELFASIRCNSCHVSELTTGPSKTAALANKKVALYSDLLLHHMGTALTDGVRQGQAEGDMWRTAPLWGLSTRQFLLHDGRTTSIDQAILLHGGEAHIIKMRYYGLSPTDKAAIASFLKHL